jgi:tetrapyrrole methylase family protein/MazG family protein
MLDALIAEARIRWGLDPADGLQVAAVERLVAIPVDAWRPLLLVPAAALRARHDLPVEPLPGRHRDAAVAGIDGNAVAGAGGPAPVGGSAAAIAVLRRLYPAGHPVGPIGHAGATTVGELTEADLAAPLYLAPLPRVEAVAGPWAMPWISDRLRRPDGCPWDREQTHRSLRKHLLEEAYEVYDALDTDAASPGLAEELGDLLLQVVLHAQLAAEQGVFDLTDVQAAIAEKIVRRHPHVFGDAVAHTASDVNRQWERIKAGERAAAAEQAAREAVAAGRDDPAEVEEPRSALDGISRSMPALAASQEMQDRAANLGYDWPAIEPIVDKLLEELGELRAATTPEERADEMGDVLMVAVNLARRHGVEAEGALRAANDKFRRRFRRVERAAAARGVALRELSFEELDELWDAAKAAEAAEAAEAAATATDAATAAEAAEAAEAADAAREG